MDFGISTASFFLRKPTEDALKYLDANGVKTCEVFFSSFCEYNDDFAKIVLQNKKNINVHSMHVLTTQYEPQLYNLNPRAKSDAFYWLERALSAGKIIGAKNYTFHGTARYKITPVKMDFDHIGKITNEIIDMCTKYGITLCYENVHWGYYNYIGFFSELKKHCKGFKGVLDIKQARQNKIPYYEFINEMKGDIVTVHVSDFNSEGKMCLPGKGNFNFKEMFNRLNDVGFNGSVLIESYKDDYNNETELLESLEFLKTQAK